MVHFWQDQSRFLESPLVRQADGELKNCSFLFSIFSSDLRPFDTNYQGAHLPLLLILLPTFQPIKRQHCQAVPSLVEMFADGLDFKIFFLKSAPSLSILMGQRRPLDLLTL